MKRATLPALAVGLLVGGAGGFVVGRRTVTEPPAAPAPEVAPPVVAVAVPAVPQATAPAFSFAWGLPGQDPAVPTRVAKGMTRTQAAAILWAEGFEPEPGPLAAAGIVAAWPGHAWRYHRPWEGGYHFVTVAFTDDHVSEVFEGWNDP